MQLDRDKLGLAGNIGRHMIEPRKGDPLDPREEPGQGLRRAAEPSRASASAQQQCLSLHILVGLEAVPGVDYQLGVVVHGHDKHLQRQLAGLGVDLLLLERKPEEQIEKGARCLREERRGFHAPAVRHEGGGQPPGRDLLVIAGPPRGGRRTHDH